MAIASHSPSGRIGGKADESPLTKTMRTVSALMERIGMSLTLICAIVVALVCVATTAVNDISSETFRMLSEYSPFLIIGSLMAAVIVGAGMNFVAKVASRATPKHVLSVCVATTAILSLIWVTVQETHHAVFADSLNLLVAAEDFVNGTYWDLPKRVIEGEVWDIEPLIPYLSHYPFQSGMFLYYVAMFRLFGAGNLLALQYAGVVANEVVLVCLYAMGRHLFSTAKQRNMLTICLSAFLPFWMLACFPYGNSVGFGFTMAFLALQVEALVTDDHQRQIVLGVASAPLLVLALTIKSTFILVALAVITIWVIRSLRKREFLGLLVATLALVLSTSVTKAEIGMTERMFDTKFGDGIPKISWLMLGLTESEMFKEMGYDMPGFWDGEAYDLYEMTDGDAELQSEIAMKRITNRIAYFGSNFRYGVKFFARKLAAEWSEPTYQTLVYSAYNMNGDGVGFGYNHDGQYLLKLPRLVLTTAYDGYQSVISILAVVGIATLIHRHRYLKGIPWGREQVTGLVLCATFCVGFLCYLLWEAKSVYILPFFIMLLPLAVIGYDTATVRVRERMASKTMTRMFYSF